MTRAYIYMYLLLTWFRIGWVEFMRSDGLRAWLAMARTDRRTAERRSAGRCDCPSAAVSGMGRSSPRSVGARGAVATSGQSTSAATDSGRFSCDLRGLRRNMRPASWPGPSGLTASAGLGPGAAAARVPQINREYGFRTAPSRACMSGAVGQGSGAGRGASGVRVHPSAWRLARTTAGAVGDAGFARRTALTEGCLGRSGGQAVDLVAHRGMSGGQNLYGDRVTYNSKKL